MTRLIATVFYIGYLRPAPGTWGSLAALPLGLALMLLGGPWLLIIGTAALFGLGWWATVHETRRSGNEDPSEIVVDEVVGQWIALWPLAIGAANVGASYTALWPGWVVAFALFRLFDIKKWGPVGWADRRGDPLGVMLDDVIAGVFAAIGVVLFAGIYHGIILR
ncbi:phosphatidylglycerophosphatase A family protein [Loktanella salsilacus]|jgi:phosphatidylglycerophosphatase A|uniref:phosphatidylglycerophosphatase A family protein n=1 Tax=Loktanella salsilacus TaxID=195913 RepID=UPI0020B8283E|nr:phosphatidylglycerophosphatase A [Loktanella salsilacus]UTH45737.1 phosphatidylglycerophosphatase A [Loktanella salsilacus]